MADAPSLGDFFAKKQKKKIKGSNLNVVTTTKPDSAKKPKSKDAEAEGWQEEEVVAATMKVEVAGKLTREEEKKEEEDTGGHAWGSLKAKSESSQGLSDRKFPTLAKSVRTSTNINIDDGSNATVNIATSKNVFAALENEEDDDDAEVKRPKEIKPAMVTKKKGEREKVAIQREVDKYIPAKETGKKDGGKKGEEDDEDEDEEADEDEEQPQQDEVVEERKPEAKKKKKLEVVKEVPDQESSEQAKAEDLMIVADLEAAKAKYVGRKKPFPAKTLPKSELEEEKENKPVAQGKKKKQVVEFDFDKPKLQFWE